VKGKWGGGGGEKKILWKSSGKKKEWRGRGGGGGCTQDFVGKPLIRKNLEEARVDGKILFSFLFNWSRIFLLIWENIRT